MLAPTVAFEFPREPQPEPGRSWAIFASAP